MSFFQKTPEHKDEVTVLTIAGELDKTGTLAKINNLNQQGIRDKELFISKAQEILDELITAYPEVSKMNNVFSISYVPVNDVLFDEAMLWVYYGARMRVWNGETIEKAILRQPNELRFQKSVVVINCVLNCGVSSAK